MTNASSKGYAVTGRMGLLFCIFFLIACGLGYPILNRYDPRQTPGLFDVRVYAELVTGSAPADAGHMRFRVLVPWIARPFYLAARGRVGSWDPAMFALLAADSLFVAGTAVLIVILGRRSLGDGATGLAGSLLYLVNFAVPNLRLAGLVDAGEGFFLLLLLFCLSEEKLWPLPAIGICGALTKESFIPFSMALTLGWWLSRMRFGDGEHAGNSRLKAAAWIAAGWLVSVATVIALQSTISGHFASPLQFGLALHRGHDYAAHMANSLADRNLWYVFLWLLPAAIPNLKRLPKSWGISLGAACAMAFVLDAYFGGVPGTLGRALFSIVGPALSLSAAMLLLRICS